MRKNVFRGFLVGVLLLLTSCGGTSAVTSVPTATQTHSSMGKACSAKAQPKTLTHFMPNDTSYILYVGYQQTPNRSVSGDWYVCVRFTVPNATCSSSSQTVAIWGGLPTQKQTLPQTGIDFRGCPSQGGGQWHSWYEVATPGQDFVPHTQFSGILIPGDSVTVWVAYLADTGQYSMGVNKNVYTTTLKGFSPPVAGEVYIEPEFYPTPGQQSDLANYGTVSFNCLLNNLPLIDQANGSILHSARRNPQTGKPNSSESVQSTDSFSSTFLNP